VTRLIPLIVVILVLLAVFRWLGAVAIRAVASRSGTSPRRAPSRAGGYEFDRRSDQARRDLKNVGGRPAERRSAIVEWLDQHMGVEAYVEPKTVMSPLSVVLVDGAGDWKRFELHEDRVLRQLAKERALPIFDAARTGYPPRMRRGRS
jgi:hypothetical protein